MKTIELRKLLELNLSCLDVPISSEAVIYYDNDKIYKLFKCLNDNILLDKRRKIQILSNMKNYDKALLPIEMIVERDFLKSELKGYSREYLKGISLDDLSLCTDRTEEYFLALIHASISLMETHKRPEGIVVSDTGFRNIIVYPDENGKYTKCKFADFDSVKIGDILSDAVSSKLFDFYFRKGLPLDYTLLDENTDRLTLILYFFESIFGKSVLKMSYFKYDEMAERYKTFDNLREVFYMLNVGTGISTVPYLHEVIDIEDAATLVRKL